MTDKQHASVTFSTDEIESQLHRLGTVLSYCDKNSRELQTVNLMAQRNVPVTFVPETTSRLRPVTRPRAEFRRSTGRRRQGKTGSPDETCVARNAGQTKERLVGA